LHCRVRHLGNRTVSFRHSATSACGSPFSGIFH
jgi:hypothetical protein